MTKILKKAIFGILMVFFCTGSVLVMATAANTNPVDWVSSIRVVEDTGLSEAEESVHLAPLAKITAEQAKTIALCTVDTSKVGALTDVELENENGNVVYAVEFTQNGIETDVKIDAGNGKVLLIEDDLTEVDQDYDDEDEEEDIPITGSALDRASAAALDHIGEGQVSDTEVGDEEGYYEIEITLNNGNEVDVHLDENFKVLSTEYEEEEEDEEEDIPITGSALDRASAAALDHIGEGRVSDTEVGDEEGYYEIEITLNNGNEVDVHLDENFKVLSTEYEEEEDEEEDIPITGNALDRASAAALDHIGEGRVSDTEVGDEEGYYEIEITLNNGNEVDVHLDENFKVLSTEYEDEEEDD